MSGTNMKRIIEALLIATNTPLALKKIMEITELSKDEIKRYIDELNKEYQITGRSFEIKEAVSDYQIYTLPEFVLWVGALHDRKSKLSRAALETLAVIAYHQPIIRAEIEKMRGVDSTWILESLLQKGLVKTCGRLPVPGRPIKYATTKEFMRYFGIKDLNELPREEDFGDKIASSIEQETSNDSNNVNVENEEDETESKEFSADVNEIQTEDNEKKEQPH